MVMESFFTYPPILPFFEHFSIEDTLKINQSLQNLPLLISILSQKNIFPYGHKGKKIEVLGYNFLQFENSIAY